MAEGALGGLCYKQAVDWLQARATPSQGPITFSVGSGGHVAVEYARRFPQLRHAPDWDNGDYWIRSTSGFSEAIDTLIAGRTLPGREPAPTLHRVEFEGVPLCVVQLNRDREQRQAARSP